MDQEVWYLTLFRVKGYVVCIKNVHPHIVSPTDPPPPPTIDLLATLFGSFLTLTRGLDTASARAHLNLGGTGQTSCTINLGYRCQGRRDYRAQAKMAENPS